MKTNSLSRFFILALVLLALASTSAQAGGWNHSGGNRCWHPYYGGGRCYGGFFLPPIVLNFGPQMPPPPPAAPVAPQNIPVGAVSGPWLRSPWSTAMIPLASIRYPGQIVYDAQTGLPFRAP